MDDVRALFGTFLGTHTGQALAKALDDAGHELLILPYWNFSIYPKLPFTPLGLNSTAQSVGRPLPRGIRGTDAAIMFSPHMWRRGNKPGSAGEEGPGSKADEVLLHEMVHGVRMMMGVNAETNKLNDDYENEEEFVAVVVTNIYMAEKHEHTMRHGHGDFVPMAQPRDFLKIENYKQLLRNFRHAARDFYNALGRIPEEKAWWNPIRELGNG
jgi:hypothetical protein